MSSPRREPLAHLHCVRYLHRVAERPDRRFRRPASLSTASRTLRAAGPGHHQRHVRRRFEEQPCRAAVGRLHFEDIRRALGRLRSTDPRDRAVGRQQDRQHETSHFGLPVATQQLSDSLWIDALRPGLRSGIAGLIAARAPADHEIRRSHHRARRQNRHRVQTRLGRQPPLFSSQASLPFSTSTRSMPGPPGPRLKDSLRRNLSGSSTNTSLSPSSVSRPGRAASRLSPAGA